MPTCSGKERVPDAPQEPPRQKIKFLHQCHIPKELLEEKQIMVFVQETQHGQFNKSSGLLSHKNSLNYMKSTVFGGLGTIRVWMVS